MTNGSVTFLWFWRSSKKGKWRKTVLEHQGRKWQCLEAAPLLVWNALWEESLAAQVSLRPTVFTEDDLESLASSLPSSSASIMDMCPHTQPMVYKVVGIKPRASCMLGKCPTNWATPWAIAWLQIPLKNFQGHSFTRVLHYLGKEKQSLIRTWEFNKCLFKKKLRAKTKIRKLELNKRI